VCAVRGVDKLAGNAHPVAGLAHASFQHVAHAELATDLPHIDRLALVGEGRVARDDIQLRQLRKISDDVFANTVGKILLFGISAHICEGKNGDRRLIGQRERRWRRCEPGNGHLRKVEPVDVNGPLNILEALLAAIDEFGRHLALHLPPGVLGNRDTARFSDALDTSCDIDAVAKNVVALDDDVADIDADSELDRIGFITGALPKLSLNFDGAGHRVHGAREFHQRAVAHQLDDTAGMGGDRRID
jgi:hypothetical protein